MDQKKKAEQMAAYAYQNVPIYVKLAQEKGIEAEGLSLEQYPVVGKAQFIDSGMSALSAPYIGKYMAGELHWKRTSGSTGKFMEVYWDREDIKKSLFSLWMYRRNYYHILPTHRMCYFFPVDTQAPEQIEEEYSLGLSKEFLFNRRLEEAYQAILNYDPVWMILQPSIAMLLCELIQERGLDTPPSLRYIEFTGEYLEPWVKKRVQKIFGCQTADQYGSQEVNSIAFECPEGHLHCMQDNVYVEIEEETESKAGELCVTTLKNRAMPLVRFNLGDRGRLIREHQCPCGNSNPILELQAGRSNEWILREDGSRIHAYALMQIIHWINCETNGMILQYQICQEDYDRFLFKLVLEEDEDELIDEIMDILTERVQERLGEDTEIEAELYTRLLPEEKSGKLACFRSRLTEGVENRYEV